MQPLVPLRLRSNLLCQMIISYTFVGIRTDHCLQTSTYKCGKPTINMANQTLRNMWKFNERTDGRDRYHFLGRTSTMNLIAQRNVLLRILQGMGTCLFCFPIGKGPNDRYRSPTQSRFYVRAYGTDVSEHLKLYLLLCSILHRLNGGVDCVRIWQRPGRVVIEIAYRRFVSGDELIQQLTELNTETSAVIWERRADNRIIQPDDLLPRSINLGSQDWGGPRLFL